MYEGLFVYLVLSLSIYMDAAHNWIISFILNDIFVM